MQPQRTPRSRAATKPLYRRGRRGRRERKGNFMFVSSGQLVPLKMPRRIGQNLREETRFQISYTFLAFSVPVPAMVQPTDGILRSNRSKCLGDGWIQRLSGARLQSSQHQLDLGPAFFDRVEVRRISR